MKSRLNEDGMCREAYETHEALADCHYRRAIGDLPEMECSKALAAIVAKIVKPNDVICDVGCSAGHYFRSLRRIVSTPFAYVGIEYTPLFLEKARLAWKAEPAVSLRRGSIFELPATDHEFDYVICSNLFMHLPSIVTPMKELVRVARKGIVIRTMIGVKSFQIREVYNKTWWPATDIEPGDEFDDDGNPRSFEYENIYSEAYFSSIIKRHAPTATVSYIKDDYYSPESIERTAETEGLINPTRIVNGQQVFGYIILPYHFVVVDLKSGL